MKEAGEKGDPIEGPTISINLDSWDLSNLEQSNRQHSPADMRPPTHRQQRTSSLCSFRVDAPNPQETGGPREFRSQMELGGGVGSGWGHPRGARGLGRRCGIWGSKIKYKKNVVINLKTFWILCECHTMCFKLVHLYFPKPSQIHPISIYIQ